MDEGRLATALQPLLGDTLSAELARDFVKVRSDHATGTLERASPGKFVETFVQCLQYMATGTFDTQPSVETYLTKHAENQSALPEGLRVVGARVARTMYTLRNKRNIAHKGPIDPNTFDLALLHECAAWIMAEFLRNATGVSMQEAGDLIQLVQTPVGTLVEEIDGTTLVHANVSVRAEILILLHSRHPRRVALQEIKDSLSRRSGASVANRLGELRAGKLVHGDVKTGYRLTNPGFAAAVGEIRATLASAA
ncbi:MAG TPA: hypothetical protein VF603_07265 [Allosphingosinicella sp.]|jgi:hypothetical protein